MKFIQSAFVNWKTTLAGIAALLIALGAFGSTLKLLLSGDVSGAMDSLAQNKGLWAAAIAGIGLIFSRDANKSSEQSGAK